MNILAIDTEQGFREREALNVNSNIKHIKHVISQLPKIERAACIAAGPSLDDSWDEIKRLKADGWKIITASRPLKCFEKYGVTPDIIVHIDPMEQTENYFKCVSKAVYSEAVLVVPPNANRLLIDYFNDDDNLYFYYHDHWPDPGKHVPEIMKNEKLNDFGQVGSAVASLAFKLGAEVKLFGYDYWFWGHWFKDWDGEYGIACSQFYADPIPRSWFAFPSANLRSKITNEIGDFNANTYPYEIDENTKPRDLGITKKFTSDNMQVDRLRVINAFKHYGKEIPCELLWQ